MIDLKLRFILFVMVFSSMFIMINMIRKNKLELKYALTWLLTGMIMIIILLVPSLLFRISNLLGIEVPSNMLFTFGLFFLLLLTFGLTISNSRNSKRIRVLTQEIAVLKLMLEHQQDKITRNER